MAASEALGVQGEHTATTADSPAVPEAAAVPAPGAASLRRAQLIPVAQLVAVVLGVFAIIWNQQQTTDSLRTELGAEITSVESELRAEIIRVESELRAEIIRVESELGADIDALRAEVSANGQRLARIEGFLGIGTPEAPSQVESPMTARPATEPDA